jgi:hypothetical protein
MQLEPFANLIVQAGLGVMGQSLFLHYMPPSIDSAIVILPSLAGSAISYEMPGWRKDAGFQVIVRDPLVAKGEPLARQIMAALTITKQTLLPSYGPGMPALLLAYCRPMQDPIVFARQKSGSWEVSVNYRAAYAIQGS